MRRLVGPDLATSTGPAEVAALRLAPQLVASWLRTPAAVLQIPTGHVVGGRRLDLVTAALVERVHAMGKHVHVWFHAWSREDAEEMHRLLDLGADGIVTDHIDVLRDVLAERGHPLVPPG